MSSITLGSVQPSYLPWIPFFRRMQLSDVFVYLDDVEYSKNSFHNRNRIKGKNGNLLLTVPVRYKGCSKKHICQVEIANNEKWAKKHWKSIEINYSKSPFYNEIAPYLKDIYFTDWKKLGDLNISLITFFKTYLSIQTPCYKSSDLEIETEGNQKLVDMCKMFNADIFIVKPNTESYHPKKFFLEHDINFKYFLYKDEEYNQLHGSYVQNLSILDYVMNCGSDNF